MLYTVYWPFKMLYFVTLQKMSYKVPSYMIALEKHDLTMTLKYILGKCNGEAVSKSVRCGKCTLRTGKGNTCSQSSTAKTLPFYLSA